MREIIYAIHKITFNPDKPHNNGSREKKHRRDHNKQKWNKDG